MPSPNNVTLSGTEGALSSSYIHVPSPNTVTLSSTEGALSVLKLLSTHTQAWDQMSVALFLYVTAR